VGQAAPASDPLMSALINAGKSIRPFSPSATGTSFTLVQRRPRLLADYCRQARANGLIIAFTERAPQD
jgi:hypothetical protein